MTRVLFVCTGNVHRSVLAERLLAIRLPPGSAVRPESAGTEALPCSDMEASTRAVLEELGGDGSGFAARPLTAQLVTGAALVLGLAREHREAAVRLVPSALRRCFTLKEFVRLATGGPGGVRSGEFRVDSGRCAAVAVAAARRGTAAPVPSAEDDIADPWGRPRHVLYACAREIDHEVSRLAGLLDGSSARA
ncbi:low molecular weight phosphatase family protein [Streptomyces sp. NK08204]|uniref:arsenate reductase/protein-tyrosine-phosphatase family protein n=1 Tax=Streptomyces sp. NK08204 TaxID=2873260 RepID=UPI001CECB94D|nr:low molecular weight phosphatase family protein [Streptomyces sp. NK08204]